MTTRRKRRRVITARRDGMFGLVEQYIAERSARGEFSAASCSATRSVLASFTRHVHGDLSAVTERAVIAWLSAETRTPNTTKSMVSKLRPFVRWLVKHEHLAHDVTTEIRTPRGVYGLPRCLPVDAVARVLEACPDARARLVVTLMVQMGLRCGEVVAIQVTDVDFERRTLHIRGKGYRGDTSRAVPITDEAWAALQNYLDDDMPARGPLKRQWQPAAIGRARSSGALVRSYQPPYGHLTSHAMSALVRRWMSGAGVKSYPLDGVSAHALRHTAAQDVLDSGLDGKDVDIRHVMLMLGHRSLRTTQEYLRLDPPGLREAMEGRVYKR